MLHRSGARVRAHKAWTAVLVVAVIGAAGCSIEPADTEPVAARGAAVESPAPTRVPEAGATESPRVPAAGPLASRPAAQAALLRAASGGDGDSWKDTRGREYRMGLVNTPEYDECFGSKATAKRKELVAGGFRAQVYTTDSYGRGVSVITLPDGTNLNVWMARNGYANDKYLAEFRHENARLASQLDSAFAAAKRANLGLWGACGSTGGGGGSGSATSGGSTGSSSSCHPDYVTCIPIKGDGSGSREENDLDCPDIGRQVTLRNANDPYRLDADGDGTGCDSY